MTIQPGVGYIFTASSKGISLDTSEQFPTSDVVPVGCLPLKVKYDGYDPVGNSHFFKVCIGAVNNLVPQLDEDGVWVKLDRVTSGQPDPPQGVITTISGSGVFYLRCGNVISPNVLYPDSDTTSDDYPRIYSAGGNVVPVDDDSYSYLLLALVSINASQVATLTPVVLNSLWTSRLKCGSAVAEYHWSTI